jgi:hypothetical protein
VLIIIAQPRQSPQIRFYINLTPLIPLSFKGEGEGLLLKGLRPFKLPLINDLPKGDYFLTPFAPPLPSRGSQGSVRDELRSSAPRGAKPTKLNPMGGRVKNRLRNTFP